MKQKDRKNMKQKDRKKIKYFSKEKGTFMTYSYGYKKVNDFACKT